MENNTWLIAGLWIGLALAASLISIRVGISVALIEIVVGAVAGNTVGLEITPWVNYLAGAGAILLTFLAGAEVDPVVVRKHFWPSMLIGIMGFVGPFLGILFFARYVLGWPWNQAEIAALALSTTSVAVVYAVMVESGFNQTEIGKVILAACFVNDLGTVLVLGILFADYDLWLAVFAGTCVLAMVLLPRFTPWFFRKVGNRVSEPETKFVLLVLFALGGLGMVAKVEPVLAAYLVGMVLAPYFLAERVLPQRMRVMAFTLLTPFYFLKAGSLVKFETIICCGGDHRAPAGPEDGDQVRGHLAADQGVPVRQAGGDVHDADDVHRADVRQHCRPVRPDARHHRPGPVHRPGDGRHCQRRGADADCPEVVPAPRRGH